MFVLRCILVIFVVLLFSVLSISAFILNIEEHERRRKEKEEEND